MSGTILTERDDRICPNENCQYDNHVKGANFCVLCGTLLYHRCENLSRCESPICEILLLLRKQSIGS